MSDTRTRIIAATNELFRRTGFHGTSLKDISVASEATTGSIYHFFPGGKDELAREVLLTSGAGYGALFDLIVGEADDISSAISDFFTGAAEVLLETDFIDICPIGTVARETASTHDGLRTAAVEVFGDWTARIARHLSNAGIPVSEAERLAVTIIAIIEGSFMLARASRSTSGLEETGRHARSLVEDALAKVAR